jgi:hypothetical protein
MIVFAHGVAKLIQQFGYSLKEMACAQLLLLRFTARRYCLQWRTQDLGGQQIELGTVGRENGDLGAVAP